MLARLSSFVRKALPAINPAGEGNYHRGPYSVSGGWLPDSWGQYWNFWQMDLDPLSGGGNATVEACVWAYIRAIAQLPGYHRRDQANGGVDTVGSSALARLLINPNWYQTASDWMTHLVRSLLLTGNSYHLAERNQRNEVTALHWMNSRSCHVNVVKVDGQIMNEVFYALGDNPLIDSNDSRQIVAPARDVLHIKLETPRHPLIGESWLACLAGELANRQAINQAAVNFRPSGILYPPPEQQYTPEQSETLRQQFREKTSGQNAGGAPVLTKGIRYEQVSMSQEDARIISQLKLSDQAIARVFGVPAMLIGLSDGGTAVKTAEAEMQSWLSSGLGWLINHIEESIDKFIGLDGIQAGEYSEFDTRALLRSQFRDRLEGLVRGVQGGIYSPNEARALEGYAAVKAGDEPRVQQQVVPLSFASEPPPPPAPPAPPPSSDEPAADGEALDDDAKEVVGVMIKQLTKWKADERITA